MNKSAKILKKIEVFEKIAAYGDKSTFLKALAQEQPMPNSAALKKSLQNLRFVLKPWVTAHSEVQSDMPIRVRHLPVNMRQPYNVVMTIQNLSPQNLEVLKSALQNLLNVHNLGDISSKALNDWTANVFPALQDTYEELETHAANVKAYREKNL